MFKYNMLILNNVTCMLVFRVEQLLCSSLSPEEDSSFCCRHSLVTQSSLCKVEIVECLLICLCLANVQEIMLVRVYRSLF